VIISGEATCSAAEIVAAGDHGAGASLEMTKSSRDRLGPQRQSLRAIDA
jgi:hypothetical protein